MPRKMREVGSRGNNLRDLLAAFGDARFRVCRMRFAARTVDVR